MLAAGAAFVATRRGDEIEPSASELAETEPTAGLTTTGSAATGSTITTGPLTSLSSEADSTGVGSTSIGTVGTETTDAGPGNPESVDTDPIAITTTDASPSSITQPGTTQPSASRQTVAFDFDDEEIADWFENLYDDDGVGTANDGGESVLDINAFNIDRPLLLRSGPNGDPLVGGTQVEMEADFRISYYTSREYGARGPSHGFALKTLPHSDDQFNNPNPNAYTVAVAPHPDGISLWMGVGRDLEAEPLGYNQLGPDEGHTDPVVMLVFPMDFDLSDQMVELDYWNLSASLRSDRDNDGGWRVVLAATLSSPNGKQRSLRWVDDGPAAFGGPGRIGLVNYGVWSTNNRYDNLKITVR